MKSYLAFTLIAATLILSSSANEKWTSLFNGESLDGWIQRGGKAKYTVEDGCIVGRTIPKTPNSFLCTEKQPRSKCKETIISSAPPSRALLEPSHI